MATPITHPHVPAPPAPVTAQPALGRTEHDLEREQNDAFTSDDLDVEAQEVGGGRDSTDLTDEIVERDQDPAMLDAREGSVPAVDPDQRRRPTDEQRRGDLAQQEADERDG